MAQEVVRGVHGLPGGAVDFFIGSAINRVQRRFFSVQGLLDLSQGLIFSPQPNFLSSLQSISPLYTVSFGPLSASLS